ncbi:MAG: hypothetical protein HC813_03795 [Planctomycetes bacterium]|nr:hypothetical protein [Planctomycetota bacterium]
MTLLRILLGLCFLLAPSFAEVEAEAEAEEPFPLPRDPTEGEVPLPAQGGWRASLVLDNGKTGVWTVGSFQLFPNLGCPEVVGLDDKGVCHVLVSYSGRWTDMPCVFDGKWLGGLAHADIDPRIGGAETYVGSQRGNLYQIAAYPHGTLDSRLVGRFEGREVHTIVAGDLDLERSGGEILVFTRPAALFLLTPTGEHGRFEQRQVMDLPGRVREALLLPPPSGQGARDRHRLAHRASRTPPIRRRGAALVPRSRLADGQGAHRAARERAGRAHRPLQQRRRRPDPPARAHRGGLVAERTDLRRSPGAARIGRGPLPRGSRRRIGGDLRLQRPRGTPLARREGVGGRRRSSRIATRATGLQPPNSTGATRRGRSS